MAHPSSPASTTPQSTPAHSTLAIVGGGIGGLCLAISLS
jgi:cation diffusion facilitator CzcD-associated flavoprotein CzcO